MNSMKDEIIMSMKRLDDQIDRIDKKIDSFEKSLDVINEGLDSIENSLGVINETVFHSTETLKYICTIINLDDLEGNDAGTKCND